MISNKCFPKKKIIIVVRNLFADGYNQEQKLVVNFSPQKKSVVNEMATDAPPICFMFWNNVYQNIMTKMIPNNGQQSKEDT